VPPSQFGRRNFGAPHAKPKDLRGTLSRLWALTKGHRRGLGWIWLLSFFASASAILSPLIIGDAVGRIDSGNYAAWILMILFCLYAADWLVRFLQQFFMASIGQRIILHIRVALFDAMRKLPIAYFDRRNHGELMSRLTNDVDNISQTISDSLSQLMVYAFTILGILVFMLLKSLVLTGISLFSVFLVFLLTKAVTKRTRGLFARQQATLGRLASFIRDRRVPLEMCPTSNVNTGVCNSIAEHPIGLLARLRFRVTVNTDNRLMSDTSMSQEMLRLVEAFGYGWSDLARFTINAMKSAFIPFDERLAIIDEVIKPRFAVLIG
jgi:hypothetical protein